MTEIDAENLLTTVRHAALSGNCVELLISPQQASATELSEILSGISKLYCQLSGSRLHWRVSETRVTEAGQVISLFRGDVQ